MIEILILVTIAFAIILMYFWMIFGEINGPIKNISVKKENYINHLHTDIPPIDDLENYVVNQGQTVDVILRVSVNSSQNLARKITDLPSKITLDNMPGWTEELYDDRRIDKFLYNTFGSDHRITKAYYSINKQYGVCKADYIRAILVYIYGYRYLDRKSYIKKLGSPIIPEEKEIWLSHWPSQTNTHLDDEGEFINWHIYARSGSKILKEYIERITYNIEYIKENPDKYDEFNMAIGWINQIPVLGITGPMALLLTYKASEYKDTVLIDDSINDYIEYTHPSCVLNKPWLHYGVSGGRIVS